MAKKKAEKNINTILAIIVIVGLVAMVVIFFQLERSAVDEVSETAVDTTEEETFDAIKYALKQELIDAHGWLIYKFDLTVTFADSRYIVAHITSFDDPSIPEGTMFARIEQDGSYTIIFDSTTEDPCSTLSPNIEYPQTVTELCETTP